SGGHRGSSLDGMRCPGAARPRRTQTPRALSARGAWEVACQWLKQHDHGSRWAGCHRRSEEHTSELQSRENLVCRLLLDKKKNFKRNIIINKFFFYKHKK